tara:strand:- start:219 stop:1064 length:846 start_codon:yes stop_codon:yes gene_type:complete
MPRRQSRVFESGNGLVALAQGIDPRLGRYWEPLECMWQFSTPFALNDAKLVDEFYACSKEKKDQWDLIILTGLAGLLLSHVVRLFENRFSLLLLSRTTRISAYIGDGMDGFLGRRTAHFRRSIRRSIKRCSMNGIEFEFVGNEVLGENWEDHYERALRVELRSHKGLSESGIDQPGMQEFYRLMIPRLVRRGAFQLIFARRDGVDLGYLFGGRRASVFRGLQMSFDESFRSYALGNVLQYKMIEFLGGSGCELYDLGSDMEYKRRWGENEFNTVSLGIVQA